MKMFIKKLFMADFRFIKNNKTWVILAPRRAKRPDEIEKKSLSCPFCDPKKDEIIESKNGVLVLKNKFPFAKIHEIIVHSSSHHKNFDELEILQVENIFNVFKVRFNLHKTKGHVVIFHNFGHEAGASVAHPHSQIVVVPFETSLDIAPENYDKNIFEISDNAFLISCPENSQWPDEVWISLKKGNKNFGELNDLETRDLAFILRKTIKLLDLRHGHDFSYNFYITPTANFYLRIIPRQKKIGGFELATNIYVNTQEPTQTLAFLKKHWNLKDNESISLEHKAEYKTGV